MNLSSLQIDYLRYFIIVTEIRQTHTLVPEDLEIGLSVCPFAAKTQPCIRAGLIFLSQRQGQIQ